METGHRVCIYVLLNWEEFLLTLIGIPEGTIKVSPHSHTGLNNFMFIFISLAIFRWTQDVIRCHGRIPATLQDNDVIVPGFASLLI